MKDLHNYLTEKLKLSDIKTRRPQWVDANDLSLDDIREGYIIETAEAEDGGYSNRYICVPAKIAKRLFTKSDNLKKGYIFLQKNKIYHDFVYLDPERYRSNFPEFDKSYSYTDYTIIRVYTREKQYKNSEEVELDILKINNL